MLPPWHHHPEGSLSEFLDKCTWKKKKSRCAAHCLLSLAGMAPWWCEGRFCSGGMLLLPPAPTSSGQSSQRQAREGASSAGSWSPALSSLVVSPEGLPTAGLLLPSALLVPKPAQFGFQAFPSLNIPSPDLCKAFLRTLRVVEGTSEAAGPVWASASA